MHAQPGIFAVGAPEHGYLELAARDPDRPQDLLAALAGLLDDEPPLLGTGVVVGLRPSTWTALTGERLAPDFVAVRGAEVELPATQQDAFVWLAGPSRDAVWSASLAVIRALEPVAEVAHEVDGWVYRHHRDLTGFVDGTENPSPLEAADVALTPAGASVALVQQWEHERSFGRLDVAAQERVVGRTKGDSEELDPLPADSHVARTVVEQDGKELQILRRNTAYGDATRHGTMFVAFCASVLPYERMLARMAGVEGGVRDALTRHTRARTGAYYVIPPLAALAAARA